MIPDSPQLSRDLEHLFRRQYYQNKRSGEETDTPLLFMGLITAFIGASMAWRAWSKMRSAQAKDAGPRSRMR